MNLKKKKKMRKIEKNEIIKGRFFSFVVQKGEEKRGRVFSYFNRNSDTYSPFLSLFKRRRKE
jgi:hypothetical protein